MFDVGDRIIGLELPDTFYKLAELLEQDQFELLIPENTKVNTREGYWLFLIKKKRSMFWSCIRETA